MSRLWKIAIGLALALPMTAYVAGSLASSTGAEPGRRDPVIIRDAETPSAPARSSSAADPDTGEVDDNGIRVVNPEPTRLSGRDRPADDDEDDDGTADDGDDDGEGQDDETRGDDD